MIRTLASLPEHRSVSEVSISRLKFAPPYLKVLQLYGTDHRERRAGIDNFSEI